ncbi:hypothetical protein, partial [Neobacillus drentensis]|uniref:hypothetical protein n=1 Tax=Neobacillus drentensis TaxID=220684 RepID=UPI002FFE2748
VFIMRRGKMLRNVIMVRDDEESVKQAIREILRSKNKGHEVALDLTRIKDKARKTEIMKRLTSY